MKPEVRRWLLDLLGRHKLWVTAIILVHLGGSIFSFHLGFPWGSPRSSAHPTGLLNFCFGISWISFPLITELRRKPFQVLLSLPLNAEDVRLGLWWAAVGIPAVVTILISLIACVIQKICFSTGIDPVTLLIWCVGQWGVLGVNWWSLTHIPVDAQVMATRRISASLASTFWGVQNSFLLFFVPTTGFGPMGILLLSAFGLCFALGGGPYTQHFIPEWAGRVGGSQPDGKPIRPRRVATAGLLGWPAVLPLYALALAFAAGMQLFVWVFTTSMFSLSPSRLGHDSQFIGFSAFALVGVIFCASAISGIRVIRVLPWSSGVIAVVLFLHAWIPPMVGLLLMQLAAGGMPGSSPLEIWPLPLALLLMSAFVPAASIRFGMKATIIPMVMATSGGIPAAMALGSFGRPLPNLIDAWYVTLPALLLVAIAFRWARWEIRNGRKAYRSQPGDKVV